MSRHCDRFGRIPTDEGITFFHRSIHCGDSVTVGVVDRLVFFFTIHINQRVLIQGEEGLVGHILTYRNEVRVEHTGVHRSHHVHVLPVSETVAFCRSGCQVHLCAIVVGACTSHCASVFGIHHSCHGVGVQREGA